MARIRPDSRSGKARKWIFVVCLLLGSIGSVLKSVAPGRAEAAERAERRAMAHVNNARSAAEQALDHRDDPAEIARIIDEAGQAFDRMADDRSLNESQRKLGRMYSEALAIASQGAEVNAALVARLEHVLDFSTLESREDIASRKRLLTELELHSAASTVTLQRIPGQIEALVKSYKFSKPEEREIIASFNRAFQQDRRLKMVQLDVRFARLATQLLDLLDQNFGAWYFDEEFEEVLFADDDVLQEFNRLATEIDECHAASTELEALIQRIQEQVERQANGR